jgi:hypothetical protein
MSCFAFIFFVGSYIIWEAQFSILRYAIPIESLLGAFCLVCLSPIFLLQDNHSNAGAAATAPERIPASAAVFGIKHLFAGSILVAFSLSSIALSREYWVDGLPSRKNYITTKLPKLQDNTLVLLDTCSSFLAPILAHTYPQMKFAGGLPRQYRADGLNKWKIGKLLNEVVQKHDGPIVLFVPLLPGNVHSDFGPLGVESSHLYEPFQANLIKGRVFHVSRTNGEQWRNRSFENDFIKNTMTHPERFTPTDPRFFYTQGWYAEDSAPNADFRRAVGSHSSFGFFLKDAEKPPKKISISGFPNGHQTARITLNGREIFSGIIPADGFTNLPIPDGALRPLREGENSLEFFWPDARAVGNGDPRLSAFALREIRLHGE